MKVKELDAAVCRPTNRVWSEKEIEILLEYYRRIPSQKLCAYLNRSYESITCKCQSLKRAGREFRHETE